MLKFFGFALACLMAFSQSTLWAGGQSTPPTTDPTPVPTPVDPGDVFNGSPGGSGPGGPGKVNSWISRVPIFDSNGNITPDDSSAIALTLAAPDVSKTIRGTLVQYKIDSDSGQLTRQDFQVFAKPNTAPTTTTQPIKYFPIKLVPKDLTRYPSYDIVYEKRTGYPEITDP